MTFRTEEAEAAKALATYLRGRGCSGVNWEEGHDPPDVIFTVGAQRWGVEVTRTNKQVRVGTSRNGSSRHGIDVRLRKLGCEVRDEVAGHCQHYYLLLLSAPAGENFEDYRRRVKGAVVRHIKSGATHTLALNPGELTASEEATPGVGVIVGRHQAPTPAGHAVTDVAANVEEMLHEVWARKQSKLSALRGFDKRVLILLNQYSFATPEEVAKLLPSIMGAEPELDFVFVAGIGFRGEKYFTQVFPFWGLMSRQSASTRCLGGFCIFYTSGDMMRAIVRGTITRLLPRGALKRAQLARVMGQQRLAELAEELEAEKE